MSRIELDHLGNQILSTKDLLDAISFDTIEDIEKFAFNNKFEVELYNQTVKDLKLNYKKLRYHTHDDDLLSFDISNQQVWFMPEEYKNLDIIEWVRSKFPPWADECIRIEEELQEFKSRNMIDLLRWLKYFVDTCETNDILYGVGRGSSVASYVLYIIGVHSIDSIKYELDYKEFFK